MVQSSGAEMLLILGGSVLIAFMGWALSSAKSTSNAVDADEAWTKMPASGKYTLNFYRQSGNHHRTVEVYGSRSDVESEIFKVFQRAGIDDQFMVFSPSNGIDYRRTHYNHRGSNEGKKVGGCLVTAN
ncbi:hypothetical protein [Aeromonas cavernicola]|uniref:Uncharacterized protein n=1 Tax=Aeromonas cavernicola TaxID=1006623 RepID=A0A2H9U4I6_9GAMM|nr:hypothetical protein [Aeromonas cavernicola]PJG58908.1 hypothetical protein CUC53_10140 [Aeromonas cavernicola]